MNSATTISFLSLRAEGVAILRDYFDSSIAGDKLPRYEIASSQRVGDKPRPYEMQLIWQQTCSGGVYPRLYLARL